MEVGRREQSGRRVLAQINVTPFVDVMLVLLIIFMVTAPLMEKGIDVNLPAVEKAPDLVAVKEPLVLTVTRSGAIAIGNSKVESVQRLDPVLKQILSRDPHREVFLEADRDVPYGRVVEIMAAVKAAGVTKLGMVAQSR